MDNSSHRPKSQQSNDFQMASPQKFTCEPCYRDFTTHKAYLRHLRETRRHRDQENRGEQSYPCAICSKPFARVHDRERHLSEQHGDGKVPCSRCGKVLRHNARHKNSAGSTCEESGFEGVEVTTDPTESLELFQTGTILTPAASPILQDSLDWNKLLGQSENYSPGSVPNPWIPLATFDDQAQLLGQQEAIPLSVGEGFPELPYSYPAIGNEELASQIALEGLSNRQGKLLDASDLTQGDRQQLFHHAVSSRDIKLLEAIITHVAEINSPDFDGKTALQVVVGRGSEDAVQILLQHGASTIPRNVRGSSPLMLAVEKGFAVIAKQLLRHGAKTQLEFNGPDMLRVVARNNDMECLRLLLAHGLGPTAVSAVEEAIKLKHLSIVRLLLEHNAPLPRDGLAKVVMSGADGAFIKFVLANRAHCSSYKYDTSSALAAACKTARVDIVRLLLEAGADTNYTGIGDCAIPGQDNPLVAAASIGNTEILRLLLVSDARVDFMIGPVYDRQRVGMVAMREAVRRNHTAALQMLIDHGARHNEEAPHTLLCHATFRGHVDCARILLGNGADVNARCREFNHTALICPATNGHYHVVEYLLAQGADLEAQDFRGCNALMVSAARGKYKVVEYLIAQGADVRAKDAFRHTVWCYASGHKLVFLVDVDDQKRAAKTMKSLLRVGFGSHDCSQCGEELHSLLHGLTAESSTADISKAMFTR